MVSQNTIIMRFSGFQKIYYTCQLLNLLSNLKYSGIEKKKSPSLCEKAPSPYIHTDTYLLRTSAKAI